MNFDREKIKATQQMSGGDSGIEFASVIYIETQNKVLDFAPGNQGPEKTEEETPKEESGYDSDNVFSDCQSDFWPADDNNNKSDGTGPKVMTSFAEAEATPKSEIEKLINKLIGGETAPKVMMSSDKAMTSSVVHPGNQKPDSMINVKDAEKETGEQVKTILPLISYTEDEEEDKPIYEFDFSWMA
jgi:hypothetical protein